MRINYKNNKTKNELHNWSNGADGLVNAPSSFLETGANAADERVSDTLTEAEASQNIEALYKKSPRSKT